MLTSADLLIEPRWLLAMTGGGALEGHAVVVDAGRILAVGPATHLRERFAAREHVVRPLHALIPGLVNAHTRASLTLLRAAVPHGAAAALPQACASADFVRDGTRLAIAEMLRAGITCFADLSPHPEESARVAAAAQVRAAIALPVGEAGEGATSQLARAERLWDEHRSDARLSFFFAPQTARHTGDATLSRIRRVADELDARLALILAPEDDAADEVRDGAAAARTDHGAGLVRRFASLGLLRPGAAVIGTPAPAEADLIARHGAALIGCPQAALRSPDLNTGARAAHWTGLGSGSPAVVGSPDMLAEARMAVLLGGIRCAEALRLATLGSAAALGLHGQIGSIEPGKIADLTCISLESLAGRGSASIEDAILFGATREAVTEVWAAGRAVVRERALLAFDTEELAHIPVRWAQRLKMGAAA